MRLTTGSFFLAGGLLVLCSLGCTSAKDASESSFLDCAFEDNAIICLRERLARDIDQIELEVSGKKRSEPPMSVVLEQAGNYVAEVVSGVEDGGTEEVTEAEEQEKDDASGESRGMETARKKKFGKKKKKHLHKILALAMLLKAKLSLLLQLISTHLQVKFFVIAVISLILNAARFWLDLKKSGPSKVVYYEHAQHQHHHEHEDDYGGYWGRSTKDGAHESAYNAHVPEK